QHHSRSKALLACSWDDVEEPAAAGVATRCGGCLLQRAALLRSRSGDAAPQLGGRQRPQGPQRLAAAAALSAQEGVEVQRQGPQARAGPLSLVRLPGRRQADREQVRPAHRSERLLHREALAGQFASTGPALFWPLVPPTPPEASAATTRTSHATRQRINSRIDAFDAVAASEFASRSP